MPSRIKRFLTHPPVRVLLSMLVIGFFGLWLLFSVTTHFGLVGSALVSAGCCAGVLVGQLFLRAAGRR